MMVDKKDIKEKTKKIYEVLPKLDDQRCGYKTCGEFARAVVEGKAPCYGCVSGGPEVAAKVCEIMEARVPEEVIPQFGSSPGFYQSRLGGGRGMGMGMGRGMGRGMGKGRGMGAGMMPRVGPAPQPARPEQELEALRSQSQALAQQLSEIQHSIEELEKKGEGNSHL